MYKPTTYLIFIYFPTCLLIYETYILKIGYQGETKY
jgi:hypothetical protein